MCVHDVSDVQSEWYAYEISKFCHVIAMGIFLRIKMDMGMFYFDKHKPWTPAS